MRTLFCLVGALVVGFGLIGGCSSDNEKQETTSTGGTTSAGTGGKGSTAGDAGISGSTPVTRGDVIEFVPGSGDVPYALGENTYGIHGGGFLARSSKGNTITIGDDTGKICIKGELEEVPDSNSYSQYWGVEVGFNLNQGVPGSDSGTVNATTTDASEVAQAWMPGKVVGFSFVIEGPTINLIRFKALPAGADPSLEASVYCMPIDANSGDVQDGLFKNLTQYCWTAGNPAIPLDKGLANISWQLPADVGVGARPFDWCLSELRPLLAP